MKENNTESENKLFQILTNESFTSKFISWAAGDGAHSDFDQNLYRTTLQNAGSDLYVKLLFFITHEVFDEQKAKVLWEEIINHKNRISEKLGRNVEITVATLDYLTNVEKEIINPKLIGEAFIGKIAHISSVDPLTKLYNRQYLTARLPEELIRYKRYRAPLSLLLIDIDDFKDINDTYGHSKGDSVLVNLSEIFIDTIRDLDICIRYGGEEFLIILPHTKRKFASKLAERLRKNVRDFDFEDVRLTISIGISNCPANADTVRGLINSADEALYLSKTSGKNKVTLA